MLSKSSDLAANVDTYKYLFAKKELHIFEKYIDKKA